MGPVLAWYLAVAVGSGVGPVLRRAASGWGMSRPLLVFIGPSGSGKSTIVRNLASRGAITAHPTWTTRPRRSDECDGALEHEFVSEVEFDCLGESGFFLDRVQMFGLPHWYALPAIARSETGPIDAVMLRAPLVPRLREFYDPLTIYQIASSRSSIDVRLTARGLSEDEFAARVSDNDRELATGRAIADRQFANDRPLEDVIEQIERALQIDFAVTEEAR